MVIDSDDAVGDNDKLIVSDLNWLSGWTSSNDDNDDDDDDIGDVNRIDSF